MINSHFVTFPAFNDNNSYNSHKYGVRIKAKMITSSTLAHLATNGVYKTSCKQFKLLQQKFLGTSIPNKHSTAVTFTIFSNK